ncbi:MAG: hypothetical protein K5985_08135 [Lachnospiraceae bacterium]|nr:hypothetical protein [Lachnospiraceae bacterium]
MIQINLDTDYERPVISLDVEVADVSCLIDTGARMTVWCLPLLFFKKCFPDSVKTNYCTTVSGFGGISIKKREIWKIPELILPDENGNGKYTIKNLLVAIVDDSRIAAFSMVLSSAVFHGSSYHIFDKKNDKHLEIHPEYDRPVVCIPHDIPDRKKRDEKLIGIIELDDNEIFIDGITVFFEK